VNTPSFSCVVVDDHPALVEAVRRLLEGRGIGVAGTAGTGEEGLDLVRQERPDVAVVDLRLPGMSGIDLAREASRTVPETGIVIYTGFGDRAVLVEALDAGVRGFVLKEAPLEDLVRAVRAAAAGGTYVDPVLGAELAGEAGDRAPRLTQRERDVLRLLAEGMSNEQAGQRLYISAETVRTHVRGAMAKLKAETRTQAVATAIRNSLIR
jgi:DNA-binding NarL/FixJ family response regulator